MEGEELPMLSDDDRLAFKVANLLTTGTGGFDWAGLPLVAGWLGIADIDGLLDRLCVIKVHRPNKES